MTGKSALITGAAGNLGLQHADALLSCGADVILTDVQKRLLNEAKTKLSKSFDLNRISTYLMDVTNRDSILATCEKLNKQGNHVKILINNAAIDPKVGMNSSLTKHSRFEHFPLEEWELQLNVGLRGAFLCSQVFGVEMLKNDGGTILNIASDLSVIAPDQRLYHQEGMPTDSQPTKPVTYSVIKTGLIGLTRYLAAYWADKKIRVNALSPGGVYLNQSEDFVNRISNLIPMGRMASLDEYQAAVQFLCSDASKYMTGQNIVIDGGRSII